MSAHALLQTAHRPLLPADLKSLRRVESSMLKESGPSGPGMPLKTLIVDDEPIAQKVLREELESMEGIEIVGEADNGAVALEKIAAEKPDLVLLDLQMPAMGGLEVVRQLKRGTRMPVIVIVTAYDRYALEAFEAGAIDYLLKPVGQERLSEAVERARHFTGEEAIERIGKLQAISAP